MEIPSSLLAAVGLAIFLLLMVPMGFAALARKFYLKVEQGKALIINKLRGVEVTFTGALIWPVIYRAEIMDISVKCIQIDRTSQEGLICMDNIRADIKVAFFVRVNKNEEDVLKVAQTIGCVRASAQDTLEQLFSAKFSEALKTVGKRMQFEDLYKERDSFKDQIIEVIGRDLNGYVLEDVAIDYLEQTPIEELDADNILDSQGIRKITELTAQQKVLTNQFQNTEKKQIKKQDAEAFEAIGALERQQAEAAARQKREIETVQAREEAETAKIRAEEWNRSQLAKIKAEEEVMISNENKQRQVEVAQKNRERVVKIETERMEKDRLLEVISRERETELQRIEKERVLEEQKKQIADVVRERIAVDKTVAEEEERIKDLRLVAQAKREKEALIVHAEAEAEEKLVKQLKEAEAAEQASKFKARERLTISDAELTAADKDAKAKARMAEGLQAEYAAKGLAEARVQEAAAAALERKGLAEARATQEKMKAEAVGQEEQGLAHARVAEAEALAIEKKGRAEASAIQAKMLAEAAGLAEKAASMKALDEASRTHEEFRLKIEMEKTIRVEQLHVQGEIAKAQAEILKEAFKTAKINIVGGDGAFFERMTSAISLGKSVDGFFDASQSASTLMKDYLSGEKSLAGDVSSGLNKLGEGSGLSQAALGALLVKMLNDARPESTPKTDK